MTTMEKKDLIWNSFDWAIADERQILWKNAGDPTECAYMLNPVMNAYANEVEFYRADIVLDLMNLKEHYHEALSRVQRNGETNFPIKFFGLRKCGVDNESYIVTRCDLDVEPCELHREEEKRFRERVLTSEYTSLWCLSLVEDEKGMLFVQLHKAVSVL